MNFTVIHTNITVQDLDRSVEFYQKFFGFKVVRRVDPEDGSFRLVFLEIEPDTHRLELTWYPESDETQAFEGKGKDQGFIPHLALMPEDFEQAHQYHRDMGIVCFESEKRGIYFVKDPDGYWVEVVPRTRAF